MKIKYGLAGLMMALSFSVQAQLVPFSTSDDKMGLSDWGSGETVVDAIYSSVSTLTDELFLVSVLDENDNYKYGLLNGKTVVEILPLEYERIDDLSEGLMRGQKPDGTIAFYDEEGKEVLSNLNSKYEYVGFKFTDGLVKVENKGLYGFINKKGEEVIPLQYSDVRDFSEGLAAVQKKNKFGFINTKGELVIPYQFEVAYEFSDGMCKVAQFKGAEISYGYIDSEGKQIVPYKYSLANDFFEGHAVVQDPISEKFGYVNKKGEEIGPLKYDTAFNFSKGRAFVWLNGTSFYINTKGEKIN